MKKIATIFAGTIVASMVSVTVAAALTEPIWRIPKSVTRDPWFKATLLDAYFGFLTFYAWVYHREKTVNARALWFVLIMLGGNAAMSTYALVQLMKLPDDATFDQLLRGSEI